MVLTLYGSHLAFAPTCDQPKVQPTLEYGGVRVLIGTSPAELLYVSPGQINFKIPADVLTEGSVPLSVCADTVCSAPLPMFFSTHTALLSLEKPAYVHMPVWVHVDPPPPYFVSYPCLDGPWMPPGYEFEVRHNGTLLPPVAQPVPRANRAGSVGCDGSGSLPLHLVYRFDEPGTYSVRFTATKEGKILYRSEWTDFAIAAYSEEGRDAWLRSLTPTIEGNSREIVSNVIPSLLAWPDAKALSVLLKIIPANTSQCTNYGCILLASSLAAVGWFDHALLRAQVPPARLRQLCPPVGSCR
jgi:hypothetical protein